MESEPIATVTNEYTRTTGERIRVLLLTKRN